MEHVDGAGVQSLKVAALLSFCDRWCSFSESVQFTYSVVVKMCEENAIQIEPCVFLQMLK